MSYSFNVKAKTKQALKEAAGVEVAKVVSSQHLHAKDQLAIIKTCNAFTDYIERPLADDESYALSSYGSVTFTEQGISAASINVSTSIVKDA